MHSLVSLEIREENIYVINYHLKLPFSLEYLGWPEHKHVTCQFGKLYDDQTVKTCAKVTSQENLVTNTNIMHQS